MTTDTILADESIAPLVDAVGADIDTVGTTLTELQERTRRGVRQRPVVAILGAVAFGFVMGRIVSSLRRARR